MRSRLASAAPRPPPAATRYTRRVRTAVPYAQISVQFEPISEVSKRMATIASAPFASASSTIRCITSFRLSTSAFVIPFSSPPRIDLKLAPSCDPMLRERTVRPITSPSTSTISTPGSSFVVDTNITSPRFSLQDVPGAPHVGLRRPCVADRESQDVATVELRVGHEDLAGRVHALEERLVLLVGGVTAEADEREAPRRSGLPTVGLADPALEELGEPHVLADHRLEPLAPVAAQHRPQLQRPEAAAERGPVVGEAVGLVGGAQVLRHKAERASQR